MTAVEAVHLRKLCEAATPGPWETYDERNRTWWVDSSNTPESRTTGAVAETGEHELGPEDAAFIAASRTALPACLDEIERLRAALREACEAIDENTEMMTDSPLHRRWAGWRKLADGGDR